MTHKLRIGFMGTPDFVVPVIAALEKTGHELVCLYTQPPRQKGRRQEIEKTPVHTYGEQQGIPVFHPIHFKDPADVQKFQSHDLDVAIVAAYGLLLPEPILKAPRFGCINIHPSLLPRWRGPSPIQFAIWKGDQDTGVTVMQLERAMDAGPILEQVKIPVGQKDFITLNQDLWALGVDALLRVLDRLGRDQGLIATPQPVEGVTYCRLLTKEDGRIDWTQTAEEIAAQIRGLNPWPGTWCLDPQGRRFKILKATALEEKISSPKTGVIMDHGNIACGDGSVLRIERVQPEGKNPMDSLAAINGGYIKAGQSFT